MYRAQRCEIDRRLNRQDTKRGQMGPSGNAPSAATVTRTHLQRIEDESIHIMREVVSETERPVMLYSIGKDSPVTLHLARKAFYPAKPPFPLLHVATTWKFPAIYHIVDRMPP